MYKIESGIPMPAANAGGPTTYPFADMQIGDSFAVPFGDDRKAAVARVTAAKQQYARRHGVKLSIRTFESDMRVWRTA